MARKVLPLVGFKSLRAFNAFHALLLGMKMLPAYVMEPYEDFYARAQEKSDEEKMKLLKEAAQFVSLEQEELESLICFCTDKNGVPYSAANIKNLAPDELVSVIVAVCMEISKIKIELLTDEEKKNSLTSQ